MVGVLTVNRDDQVATSLRPVSPVSTNPPAVMKVARWLKAEVAPLGGAAALDIDAQYWDLQIAFFSGLPDTRLARSGGTSSGSSSPSSDRRCWCGARAGRWRRRPDFLLQGDTISFDGDGWEEVPGFQRPWHVYRRAGSH